MKPTGTQSSLILDRDLLFQFRMWRIERIGWAAMLVIVLAASVGFFGHGPFSEATIGSSSLRIEYERFGRYRAPMSLRVYPAQASQKDGRLTLSLSNEYLLNVEILNIVPHPERTELSPVGLRFAFSAEKERPAGTIVFHLHPDKVGALAGFIQLNDDQAIAFHQFIYP